MLTGLSFILYICYILCVVRRAAYPKLIQFNARNVYKIRIVQMPRVLQWNGTDEYTLRVGRPGVLIEKSRMQMYSTMTYSHTYMYTYCILCDI